MENTSITYVVDWLRALVPGSTALLHLTTDSRKVQAGDVFFAYPVGTGDGRNYISQAIAQGAAAVIYEAADFVWDDSLTLPHLAVAIRTYRQQLSVSSRCSAVCRGGNRHQWQNILHQLDSARHVADRNPVLHDRHAWHCCGQSGHGRRI